MGKKDGSRSKKNEARELQKKNKSNLGLYLFNDGSTEIFNKKNSVKEKTGVQEVSFDTLVGEEINKTKPVKRYFENEEEDKSSLFKKTKIDFDGSDGEGLYLPSDDSEAEDDNILVEDDISNKKKPAWQDDDDTNIRISDVFSNKKGKGDIVDKCGGATYSGLLKKKFAASHGEAPAWTRLQSSKKEDGDSEDEDEDAIQLGSDILSDDTAALPQSFLKLRWLPDINLDDEDIQAGRKVGGANCNLRTEFAKSLPLALVTRTSRHSGVASLFHVTTEKCISMDHLFFHNFMITSSAFLPNDSRFMLASDISKDFFIYDMEAAKEIRIPWTTDNRKTRPIKGIAVLSDNELLVQEPTELTLIDMRTFRSTASLKGPSEPENFSVSSQCDTIYTHGLSDGKVCLWDVNSRRIRTSFLDEGCIQSTSMAISPNNKFLACGSDSGIVNIYDTQDIAVGNLQVKPVRELGQLTTAVNHLEFNHSSEALVMSSDTIMDDAIKIIHFPSMKAFSNFPVLRKANTSFGKVLSCRFSPNSGYLSVSTIKGRVQRIRLEYFDRY